MTEAVLLRVCRAQASLAETLIEPWLREGATADTARQLASVMPALIGLCGALEELPTATWQDLFAGRIQEIQDVGEDLRRLLDDAQACLVKVQAKGEQCLAQGYAIERFDEFERAVEAIRAVAAEHVARWPWIDKETLARSRADVAAGRCQDAREVLDALRTPVR
jgi:hypothetical protein